MPRARWTDFSGGLWIPSDADDSAQQADFAVPGNALLEATNIEYLDSGGVRGRRGSRLYDPATFGGPIKSIFAHYPRRGPREYGVSACIGANQGASGSVWADPESVENLDGTYAYVDLATPGDDSRGLLCLNPYVGPAEIPDSTLSGIIVEIVRRARPAGGIYDQTVQLWRSGALVGENRALTTVEWPGEWATILYGGPGDKWGLDSLTVAQVNAADFGIYLDVVTQLAIQQAQVQYIAVHAFVELERAATLFVCRLSDSGTPRYYRKSLDSDEFGAVVVTSPLPITYRPRAVPWQELDATFIFDGKNDVRRFDGSVFVAGPAAARKGPYAALWRNRMWATDPAELAFSVYASSINDVESWPPELQLSVGDPRAGTITGLEGDAGRLVILKDSGLWSFEGDPEFGGSLQQIAEIGCVAPQSVTVIPEGIAYVSEDGVFVLPRGGVDPVEISRPIRALFRGRAIGSKYTEAVCAYVRTRRQLWCKFSPSDSGGYLAHYLSTADGPKIAWSYVPDLDMNAAATLDGEGNDSELLVGGADGFLRQYDTGSDDAGTAITSRVRTAGRQLDAGMAEGQIRRLVASARLSAAATFGVRYDKQTADAETQGAGVAPSSPGIWHPRATFVDLAQKGRFASLSLASTGGPEFELHVIDADFVLKTGLQWNP